MQARYQEPGAGRFVSQDPAILSDITQFLLDPQQQNTYSYARNNPLALIDSTGEKVEIASRSVFGGGAHLFFRVTPDNPTQIGIEGLPAGTESFTMGAYNPNFLNPWSNTLQKDIGYEGDATPISTDSGAETLRVKTITPPDGMSDTDFINNLGAEFNNTPDGQKYYLGGNNRFVGGRANSNNFVHTLGSRSGVGDQVAAFNSGRPLRTPGQSTGLSQQTTHFKTW